MNNSLAMIQFTCNQCQSALQVPAKVAGQKVRCPRCNNVVDVTQPRSGGMLAGTTSTPAPPGAAGSRSDGALRPLSSPAEPWDEPEKRLRVETIVNRRIDPLTAPGEETTARRLYRQIHQEIGKIFVGQQELVLGTLVALFSGGHVLIESVPGLGKTLFVRTLGKILGCHFGRIQFTADLMPSDITGAPIFNMKSQEFQFRRGPVFTQLLLADEINRAPAKTHAALLEIMQEKNVTVDGVTHELTPPFIVLATQNPVESEGTYNLPEAQLDRFMFKLLASYPSEEQEARILSLHATQKDLDQRLIQEIETVASAEEIVGLAQQFDQIRVDSKLFEYVNRVVRATRHWPQFHLGASPRAGISLIQGARTLAAFCGRDFVVPDDVVQLALPALRHRISLTAEAEVEGHGIDELLQEMLKTIEVPRTD